MRKTLPLALAVLAALFLCFAELADAKRFGGGRSFGSRPSYNKSFSKQSTTQQTQTQRNAASGTSTKKPGLFGGMGGMLGGLLAGSLLGSLLFGGGFGGFGMFDMLLIGLVIFFAIRLFKGRKASQSGYRQASYSTGPAQDSGPGQDDRFARAETSWDSLRSEPRRDAGDGSSSSGASVGASQGAMNAPAGFDQDEFLEGAKAVYTRMQEAWDYRDLADIKEFTSPSVYSEIEAQAKADPEPSKTEILLINAKLLEVKQEGGETLATVYFDVLMREDAGQSQPSQVREVWHFSKPEVGGNWKLDGLQQLEE